MSEIAAKHFLLTKRAGPDARGRELSASEAANLLLDVGVWPLWEHTRNRKAIVAGSRLAVYLSGSSQVVATACVAAIESWTPAKRRSYPLMLDGTPETVLILKDVRKLHRPVEVRERLSRLSFVTPGVKKWGVAFMGGTRRLTSDDFLALTVVEC